MQTIKHLRNKWLRNRRLRRWQRLIERHQTIAQEGLDFSAKALKITEEKVYRQIKLVRVHLSFEYFNGSKAMVVSKCLLKKCPSLVEGRTVHFKLLPGDLSQIVFIH